jgi:hypothetical protein
MDLDTLIRNINDVIINPLITFLFAAAVIIFLYGMVRFLANRNMSSEAAKKGKQNMMWGIVGMMIMASVFGILEFIANTLDADYINVRRNTVDLQNVTNGPDQVTIPGSGSPGSPGTTNSSGLPGVGQNPGTTTTSTTSGTRTPGDFIRTVSRTLTDDGSGRWTLANGQQDIALHAIVNDFATAVGDELKEASAFPARVTNIDLSLSCSNGKYVARYTADLVAGSQNDYHYYFGHRGSFTFSRSMAAGNQTLSAARQDAKARHDGQIAGLPNGNIFGAGSTYAWFGDFSNITAETNAECNPSVGYAALHETFFVAR